MRTIGLVLLILTVPALLATTRDDRSVQAHLATCPDCSDLESNPIGCKVAMSIGRAGHDGEPRPRPSLAKDWHSHRHVAVPGRRTHGHEKSGRI